MKQKLPVQCPSCSHHLIVSQLSCENCKTNVSGHYALPTLLQLSPEEQDFIFKFLLCGGSLKDLATEIGNSYPTVRNRLDEIIEKIKSLNNSKKK
jgi:hypothetical protein